jgi:hypothetical protein
MLTIPTRVFSAGGVSSITSQFEANTTRPQIKSAFGWTELQYENSPILNFAAQIALHKWCFLVGRSPTLFISSEMFVHDGFSTTLKKKKKKNSNVCDGFKCPWDALKYLQFLFIPFEKSVRLVRNALDSSPS